jgi:asparaginyl-tRNA synthetase
MCDIESLSCGDIDMARVAYDSDKSKAKAKADTIQAMSDGKDAMSSGKPVIAKYIARLSELSKYIGQYVRVHGWVYSTRDQGGALVFVDLDQDATGPVRLVAHPKCAPDEDVPVYGSIQMIGETETDDEQFYQLLTFDEMRETQHLSIGCSIQVDGLVCQAPDRATQDFELKIIQLRVIGGVADPSKYPIQKTILKKLVSLRSLYHERFRAPLPQRLMITRSEALFAVHEFFHRPVKPVPCCDPSIMTSSDCEGAGEMFVVSPQFFSTGAIAAMDKIEKGEKGEKGDKGEKTTEDVDPKTDYHKVGLTVSSQLPLEAIAMGTGKVYTCQKSFRAEKSDTTKHLAEFLHVEYEEYFIEGGLQGLMDYTEEFVKYLIQTVIVRCKAEYDFFDSDKTSPPELHGHRDFLRSLLDKPFIRIKHRDAIQMMQDDLKDKVQVKSQFTGKMVRLKFKEFPKQGEDLGAEHEKYLVDKFGTFVFVTHWPSDIKSFYMKQVGDGTCESFDLLAPLVGELFGGSMREWRYDVLEKGMKDRGMDPSSIQWYVDLRKDGTAPHGGWGMGFDRLVMLLTGVGSVRDVVPYPVYYGHCPY